MLELAVLESIIVLLVSITADLRLFTLAAWCIQDIHTEMKLPSEQSQCAAPVILANQINKVNQLRDDMDELHNCVDQPLPFFYVHLMFLIVSTYLPIFAYKIARDFAEFSEEELCNGGTFSRNSDVFCAGHMQDDALTLLILLLYLLVLIGLGKAGEQMTDPFGIDLVDVPVRNIVMNTTRGSLALMNAKLDKSIPTEHDEGKIRTTNRWRHGTDWAVKLRAKMSKVDKVKEHAIREKAMEEQTCYYCKQKGHWKVNCPELSAFEWSVTRVQSAVRGRQARAEFKARQARIRNTCKVAAQKATVASLFSEFSGSGSGTLDLDDSNEPNAGEFLSALTVALRYIKERRQRKIKRSLS